MNKLIEKKSFWSRLLWLLLILLLASALRIYGLADESLWLDEALVNTRISESYGRLLTDWDSHRQGPLYPVITKAWCDEFGHDEFNLRIIAALFGILGIFVFYGFGKELFGRKAGLYAAFFAALSPMLIHCSQDARPYTLFVLCSIASIQYYVRILRGSRSFTSSFLFIFFALCALYSHPYGPFLVLAYILMTIGYYLSERETVLVVLKRIWIASIAVFVLYTPMLYVFARTFLQKLENPMVAGSWLVAKPISEIAVTIGEYFMWPVLAAAASAVIIAAISIKAVRERSWSFSLTVTVCLLVSFLLVPWLISKTITPIYSHRYTIPALGAVLVLLGYAITLIPRLWRFGIIAMLTIMSVFPLYHFYTGADKEPWRQTAAILEANCEENDMILLMPTYATNPFKYYYDIGGDILFRRLRFLAEFRPIPKRIDRVWFVFAHYHAPRSGDEVFNTLSNWGTPAQTIRVNETVKMNPYLYFASDIDVTRFDRK